MVEGQRQLQPPLHFDSYLYSDLLSDLLLVLGAESAPSDLQRWGLLCVDPATSRTTSGSENLTDLSDLKEDPMKGRVVQ